MCWTVVEEPGKVDKTCRHCGFDRKRNGLNNARVYVRTSVAARGQRRRLFEERKCNYVRRK